MENGKTSENEHPNESPDSHTFAITTTTPSFPEKQPYTVVAITKEELMPEITAIPRKQTALLKAITIFNSIAQKFYGDFFSPYAAKLGASGSLLGFLTSIRNLISSLFQGIFGPLSDKFGRKFFLLIGLSLSFIITTFLIFIGDDAFTAHINLLLVVVAIIQSLAICVFTPTFNATIGDVTSHKSRGSFIGVLSALGQIFAVSSSLLIAGVFYLTEVYKGTIIFGWVINIPWEVQYRISFGFSAASYVIAILLVIFFSETNKSKITTKTKGFTFELTPFKDKFYQRFIFVHMIYVALMSIVWPLFPKIQIDILFMEFYQIAIVSAVFAICMGVTQIIGGKYADKVGRKKIILIGGGILVIFPISYLPAILTGKWWLAIIANVVAGSGSGFFYTTINAYILDLSPKDKMGSYIGWKEALVGIATFIGSLSGGFLIDGFTSRYGLLKMSVIMVVSVAVLRLLAFSGYFFFKENFHND